MPSHTQQQSCCLDAIAELEQRSHAYPWSRRQLADSAAAGHHIQLLYHRQTLIGYYVAMLVIDEAHLLNIAVHADHQSQGWGGYLLRHLANWAAEQACTAILLEVRRSNQAARRLYQKMRFLPVGVRKNYYPLRTSSDKATKATIGASTTQREDALVLRQLLTQTVHSEQRI